MVVHINVGASYSEVYKASIAPLLEVSTLLELCSEMVISWYIMQDVCLEGRGIDATSSQYAS